MPCFVFGAVDLEAFGKAPAQPFFQEYEEEEEEPLGRKGRVKRKTLPGFA